MLKKSITVDNQHTGAAKANFGQVGASQASSSSCGCCAGLFAAAKPKKAEACHATYKARHSAARLLPERDDSDVSALYDVDDEPLGEGAFGVVKRVVMKSTGTVRVMKVMNKDALEDEVGFLNEIAIQADLDHPHIVRIYDTFHDSKTITLILEICKGGDCSTLLEEQTKLAELDASILFSQAVRAVAYMHGVKIVHRDLKPENFLLEYKLKDAPIPDNLLKVIDFGFAKSFVPGEKALKTICGSPWYMAPELWQHHYDEKCDIWSLGCILYLFLSGNLPFGTFEDENDVVFAAAKECKLNFKGPEWQGLSPLSKLLIARMVKPCANDRFSASSVLNSLWLKQEKKLVNSSPTNSMQKVVDRMKSFGNLNAFTKLSLFLVAHSLPEQVLSKLRATFEKIDVAGDGVIYIDEMVQGCGELGMCREDVEGIFQDMHNSSAGIEYTEFLEIMIQSKACHYKEACWEAFRILDTDGDSKISMNELKAAMAHESMSGKVCDTELAETFNKTDTNGDGHISYDEFCAMLG